MGELAGIQPGHHAGEQQPGEIVNPVSTVGTQAMRPKLTIVIAAARAFRSPLRRERYVQPGATRQFTATVTGSFEYRRHMDRHGRHHFHTGLLHRRRTAGALHRESHLGRRPHEIRDAPA